MVGCARVYLELPTIIQFTQSAHYWCVGRVRKILPVLPCEVCS